MQNDINKLQVPDENNTIDLHRIMYPNRHGIGSMDDRPVFLIFFYHFCDQNNSSFYFVKSLSSKGLFYKKEGFFDQKDNRGPGPTPIIFAKIIHMKGLR